jgi:hypothetical protein
MILKLSLLLLLKLAQCLSAIDYFEELVQDDTNHLIVPLHKYGFANRLRTLASFAYFARQINRKLYISWTATQDCSINFDEIFTVSDSIIFGHEVYLFRNKAQAASLLERFMSNATEQVGQHKIFFAHLSGFNFDISPYQQIDKQILILQHDGWFINGNCIDFFIFKKHFYRSLKLREDIQENIDKVWDTLKGRLVVGIHVRRTDPRHDWPTIASEPENINYANFDDVISVDDFANVMVKISKHVPNAIFYIATNSVNTKERIKKLQHRSLPTLKNKLFFLDTPANMLNRNTLIGMKLSIIDFIILSQTELIISTYGSSFGQEASILGSVPKLLLRHGGHIYYTNNILLPHCDSDQVAIYYNGGTRDINVRDRIVNVEVHHEKGGHTASSNIQKGNLLPNRSLSVQKHFCKPFESMWGVSNVYC